MNSYIKAMDKVKTPEMLIENVLMEYKEQEYWKQDKKADREKQRVCVALGVLRGTVVACIACFCFVFTMQVVAGSVPEIYEWLYLVSPQTAQFFKPVEKISENAGIRMEVVSAYIHDNVAEIYVTLEDLTGGRIDETVDLYDSYSIHQPFSASGSCRRVGYDEKTGKATFLIKVTQWEDEDVIGDKMTFSVREFISLKTEYKYMPVNIDLRMADREPELVNTWISGMGRGFEREGGDELSREDIKVLPASTGNPIELLDENGECIIIEGVEISGLAYSDGLLHIQKRTEDVLNNDNHGYFWLLDENREVVDYLYQVSYYQEENGVRTDYQEFVFKVAEEDLLKYSVVAHLWITGIHVDGPWQVTFPLEKPMQ